MDDVTWTILDMLVRDAGLPAVTATSRLVGRGLDNRIYAARLADGHQVVLRLRAEWAPAETTRARLLQSYGLPVPRLLAAAGNASLYEFAPGITMGEAVEDRTATPDSWMLVGRAYRRVHDIRFPRLLAGDVGPAGISLRPVDPVTPLHRAVDGAAIGLQRLLPNTVALLPQIHHLIEVAAPSLRGSTTALLHGDPNLGNILIAPDRATLVDWDGPVIGDPARELAQLDEHALLFNGRGLPRAFYDGYGRGPIEPSTSLHRLIGMLSWLTSHAWTDFERLDPDLRARTRGWFHTLLAWVARLPEHVARLRTLPARP